MTKSKAELKKDLLTAFNLTKISKEFKKYRLKVGLLKNGKGGEEHAKGPLTNTDIGVIHEFGLSPNIPARSFINMPIVLKSKEVAKLLSKEKDTIVKDIAEGKIINLLEAFGIISKKIIDEAFETGGFGQWAPNAPKTIRNKKSDTPLIDTGQLRKAITSEIIKR